MADPIRTQNESDFSETDSAQKAPPSKIKNVFKKAGKTFVYAQMLYKTSSVPEKIALQCGIQAAFFIPLNNIVGCYLLYDDYKAYKAKKHQKPEPLPFVCTQYFNDVALAPLPCKHVRLTTSEDSAAPLFDNDIIINHHYFLAPPKNSRSPKK